MTFAVWNGIAADESGGDLVILESPEVTVVNEATGANATLYSDRDGNNSLTNPFTADADGTITFYTTPGRYKITATLSGNTVSWRNELIGTAEQIEKFDPENATDSGTDAFVSETTTSTPTSGTVIIRDFQSENTTTTPTLDGNTIVAWDGSALWAGALSRVHFLLWDGTNYRVKAPHPIDEDDMASDSDTAVPTQQSVKAYVDNDAAVSVIESGTVSSASSLDITGLSTTYRMYEIIFDDLHPASDGNLFFRVSNDGGSTFDSGASDYAYSATSRRSNSSTTNAQSASASEIQLNTSALGSAADEKSAGSIKIFNPADAGQRTRMRANIQSEDAGGNEDTTDSGGARLANESNDAVQLLFDSGNIVSMNYTIYGYKAS